MLEALTHPILTPLVRSYLLSTVRGHFADVRVHLEQPVLPMPTIFFATHQSWWDGHLILALCQFLKLEFRVLMLQENLVKYGFLRYAGAFGVNRASVASVRAALRYSRSQLEVGLPRAVLLFPSGEIMSPFARPLVFESGLASLVLMCQKAGVQVQLCPLAMRLEHGLQARPSAYMRLGTSFNLGVHSVSSLSVSNLTEELSLELTLQADRLQQDLLDDHLEGYAPILRGLPSAQQGWDFVRRSLGIRL
jgi:1-acyl-sn-glycerol-3-phosphate acyltransferase